MAESTKDADSIAERLRREPEFKGKDRVLVIHTDKAGEITKKDLDSRPSGGPRGGRGTLAYLRHRLGVDAA
jgi:hypothetical protein